MESRGFLRVKIKEQSCAIDDGFEFYPVGVDEREALATVLDLSYGGASIETNIKSRVHAAFTLKFPKIKSLNGFSVNSKIVRIQMSGDSTPLKPKYLIALKFVDPEVSLIEKFIKLSSISVK